MMMRVRRRVVKFANRVDHDLLHEAVFAEQVQRVVNGRFRDRTLLAPKTLDDLIGRQVLWPLQQNTGDFKSLWSRKYAEMIEN